MSRFLSDATRAMAPYVPGEQPQDRSYIKLNTNECPYAPSLLVNRVLAAYKAEELRLYPDPAAARLKVAAAEAFGVDVQSVFAGGGSDEVLAYAFMTFFDRGDKVLFPDITYGFYRVYAQLFGLDMQEIPLAEDYSVNIFDYFGAAGHIFLANPNAPTGIALSPAEIEEILRHNPDKLVIVDEAYTDFAPGTSCVGLIGRYDNLLVVQTFSKSRALAGMRLAFAFGHPELIAGLERIKFSFNPYNLDRLSMEIAIAALSDRDYLAKITRQIIDTRTRTAAELSAMGFRVLPSGSNFLFAGHPKVGGGALYRALKERGILVRFFDKPRIDGFVRFTIGTDDEMKSFLTAVKAILDENDAI
jgi:histidinol-phosphate aminotransferase